MMIHVLDTHPLVWHLEGNPRLSRIVQQILSAPETQLVIPSIVLAEMWHLYHRKRIRTSPDEVRSRVLSASNCLVYPLDEAVLELFPPDLDIHDAIIVATTRVYWEVLKQPVRLITCDRMITESKLVQTVW